MGNEDADEEGPKLHPDVYVGVSLLVLCGLIGWNTTTFREVPAMLSQNVPPTFFPRLVLYAIAGLSAVLIVSRWRRKGDSKERIPRGVLVTAAVLTATVALVPRLGMLATVGLVSIVLPLCWGERRTLRIAILAVGLPLSIYVIFSLALGIRFPEALLP